jgi:hypothetical protein
MITVGDVDWVCLVPDRKLWKSPLNVVMCLSFVKAGKYVANGAAIKGIILKKYFCDFDVAVVNL